jgi:hypothetical protein
VGEKTRDKMKFLILFACIAAASAISFYPYEKEYSYDYNKYPLTEKYHKGFPAYEHYGKDYSYYGKSYGKDYPFYKHYEKDYPYYKDYPQYSQYHKDYPTYEHYGKEFPWYSKYYKDFPAFEKFQKYPYYSKDYPVHEKYFKDYPVHEKYFKDYPVHEKYFKDFPVHEKYFKDYPVTDKYYKNFPVHEKYFKDYPVTEKYYKDFPMYEKMFKNFDFAEFFGEQDFSAVKKDFIIFYYKYLVEIMDLFKVRFGDYLTHYETFKYDEFYLPAKCHKLSGFMHWMYTTNVDVTKYHEHFFDYFMMCKTVDYVKFIKNYFLHFNMEVMYKDYDLIHGLYGMLGDHGYGLHKYYYDTFGQDFYKYEPHYVPTKFIAGKFFSKDIRY